MNTTMPKMTFGTYQLSVVRGEDEVLRRGFEDRGEANEAVADALARYHDCEVRLSQGDAVLISAGPAPSVRTRRR